MDIKKLYLELCDDRAMLIEKQEQIEELITVATNTTMPLGEEKTYTIGGSKDRIGKVMDKVMDLEKEITRLHARYQDKQAELILTIAKTNSATRKIIALDHYVRHKSLTAIAKRYGITVNGVCKSLKNTREELFCINFVQKPIKT